MERGRKPPFFIMDESRVSLIIKGKNYYGWLSVSVSIALESITRSFSVGLTSKANEKTNDFNEVRVGDPVVVKIGNTQVLSGFITKVTHDYSSTSHSIKVDGCSKTIDLVECMVPNGKPVSYKKQTVSQIIRDLAGRYNVALVEKALKADSIDFDVSPNETIYEALKKLIKSRNLLLTDDAEGRLVLTEPSLGGRCEDKIQQGVNVLKASYSHDGSTLFNQYVLLGQGANKTSERPVGDNQLKAISEDSDIRLRVKTFPQTGDADLASMQNRAVTVLLQSRAKAETLTYTVQGWRQSNGDLWDVNTIALVNDDKLNIWSAYLISRVDYSLTDKGMTTRIELSNPDAFLSLSEATSQAAVKTFDVKKIGAVAPASWTDK